MKRNAFSLTEILIVIGIIVLVLALALPAFNFITGTNSEESAQNQIGAYLARARNQAIGLQIPYGVFFYVDPKTGAIAMTMVKQVDASSTTRLTTGVDDFLDLVPDTDVVVLPKGVGIEVIDDGGGGTGATAVPLSDRYIGFNTTGFRITTPLVTAYGGVILFDSHGQLISKVYAFQAQNLSPSGTPAYTAMGELLYGVDQRSTSVSAAKRDVAPVDPNSATPMRSSLGFVLFNLDSYKNAANNDPNGDPMTDLQIISPSPTNYSGSYEQTVKEAWLDQNATPVLINRYNGTLVKGE